MFSHFLSFLPPIYIFPEKAMAPHSSTLAWKIPWMEEPGRLRSIGSLRVRHDWATSLSLFTFTHWRRKWQPTPVFLPGESQGPGSRRITQSRTRMQWFSSTSSLYLFHWGKSAYLRAIKGESFVLDYCTAFDLLFHQFQFWIFTTFLLDFLGKDDH